MLAFISTDILLQIIAAGILAVLGVLAFALRKTNFTIKSISFGALCVALSFALSFTKIWTLPYGGSITLGRMMPLLIYAYAFGWRRGILAGLAYSILDSIAGGTPVSIYSYLLDYTIAFSSIGLAGLVRNNKYAPFLLGTLIAAMGRFIPQFISGVAYYGTYMPEAFPIQNVVVYSLWYNGTVFFDMALAYLAVWLIMKVPEVKKQINMLKDQDQNPAPAYAVEEV